MKNSTIAKKWCNCGECIQLKTQEEYDNEITCPSCGVSCMPKELSWIEKVTERTRDINDNATGTMRTLSGIHQIFEYVPNRSEKYDAEDVLSRFNASISSKSYSKNTIRYYETCCHKIVDAINNGGVIDCSRTHNRNIRVTATKLANYNIIPSDVIDNHISYYYRPENGNFKPYNKNSFERLLMVILSLKTSTKHKELITIIAEIAFYAGVALKDIFRINSNNVFVNLINGTFTITVNHDDKINKYNSVSGLSSECILRIKSFTPHEIRYDTVDSFFCDKFSSGEIIAPFKGLIEGYQLAINNNNDTTEVKNNRSEEHKMRDDNEQYDVEFIADRFESLLSNESYSTGTIVLYVRCCRRIIRAINEGNVICFNRMNHKEVKPVSKKLIDYELIDNQIIAKHTRMVNLTTSDKAKNRDIKFKSTNGMRLQTELIDEIESLKIENEKRYNEYKGHINTLCNEKEILTKECARLKLKLQSFWKVNKDAFDNKVLDLQKEISIAKTKCIEWEHRYNDIHKLFNDSVSTEINDKRKLLNERESKLIKENELLTLALTKANEENVKLKDLLTEKDVRKPEKCEQCGEEFNRSKNGISPKYCSDACKMKSYRQRKSTKICDHERFPLTHQLLW